MTLLATTKDLFHRLVEAAPVVWRQDRVFRGAAIGAGVTGALLLLRLTGPQMPELQSPSHTAGVPASAVPYPPGQGVGSPPEAQRPANVPKIAPEHSLGDVTVVPGSDRFGTVKLRKPP